MKKIYPILFITLLFWSCKPSSVEEEPRRPNIVFIMTDDHAIQATGAYGSKINETPNMDQLADEGMIFHRSYVTNSICGPSRAVMLTGKFSHINGFTDNSSSFDGSQTTFPKLLQKAGYKTAIVGKWHLRSDPTGFDYWSVLPGQGDYYYPDFITMGDRKNESGYVTDLITQKAINWMDSAVSEDEPFLLMVHHKGPHRTWMPAIRHLNKYDGVEFSEPETLFDDYKTRDSTSGAQEMSIANHMMDNYDLFLGIGMNEPGDWGDNYLNRQAEKMTDEEVRLWEEAYREENQAFHDNPPTGEERIRWNFNRYLKNYLSVVAGVDESIGTIHQYLKDRGLDENTIIVYTSDQGFYLGEHGWYDKRWMFEESFRMPLIVKYPDNIEAGSSSSQLVQNLDFAPTFLEYAGLDIPEDMQGLSMKSILESQEPESWRNSLYYHYFEYPAVHMVKRHYGVAKDNFKLIHYYHDVDTWEMYDLSSDPNEINNIYDHPEYLDIQKGLKEELQRLRVQYGDTVKAVFSPPQPISQEHQATGSTVTFHTQPAERYSENMATCLTDGIYNRPNRYYKNIRSSFLGYQDNEMDITIDLQQVKNISTVNLHCLKQDISWIHLPENIEVSMGSSLSNLKIIKPENQSSDISDSDGFIRINIESTPARYVRIKATPLQSIPTGSPGTGNRAWMMIDEVMIN